MASFDKILSYFQNYLLRKLRLLSKFHRTLMTIGSLNYIPVFSLPGNSLTDSLNQIQHPFPSWSNSSCHLCFPKIPVFGNLSGRIHPHLQTSSTSSSSQIAPCLHRPASCLHPHSSGSYNLSTHTGPLILLSKTNNALSVVSVHFSAPRGL